MLLEFFLVDLVSSPWVRLSCGHRNFLPLTSSPIAPSANFCSFFSLRCFQSFNMILTWTIKSSIATNSASIEFLVLSSCLLDVVAPFPSVMKIPLWRLISRCTAYELSTHQLGWYPGSLPVVPHRYCITLASFCYSSTSGFFTLVHRKVTAVCMPCCSCNLGTVV